MRHVRVLMLVILSVLAAIGLWQERGNHGAPRVSASPRDAVPAVVAGPRTEVAAPSRSNALPPEVAATRALIVAGGPFPYDRDGTVFGNFEGRLPQRPRGWYHEYTVPTPGLDHRGARRIVTGGEPVAEWWYTDDHYESFRRLEDAR
jgi:ribonuclease T1